LAGGVNSVVREKSGPCQIVLPAVMSAWPSLSKSATAQPSATNRSVRVFFSKVTSANATVPQNQIMKQQYPRIIGLSPGL
jgi:hypothetical protein